jgi:hypothetical protein
MTPSEYFRELVKPAIEEFEAEPKSFRRAYTACMFAYHFADAAHVATNRDLNVIREEIASRNPHREFRVVEGVAILAKHVKVSNPNLAVRPKTEDMHLGPNEVPWDDGQGNPIPWDDGHGNPVYWTDGAEVVCTVDGRDVLQCVQETRRVIEKYLVDERLP